MEETGRIKLNETATPKIKEVHVIRAVIGKKGVRYMCVYVGTVPVLPKEFTLPGNRHCNEADGP